MMPPSDGFRWVSVRVAPRASTPPKRRKCGIDSSYVPQLRSCCTVGVQLRWGPDFQRARRLWGTPLPTDGHPRSCLAASSGALHRGCPGTHRRRLRSQRPHLLPPDSANADVVVGAPLLAPRPPDRLPESPNPSTVAPADPHSSRAPARPPRRGPRRRTDDRRETRIPDCCREDVCKRRSATRRPNNKVSTPLRAAAPVRAAASGRSPASGGAAGR